MSKWGLLNYMPYVLRPSYVSFLCLFSCVEMKAIGNKARSWRGLEMLAVVPQCFSQRSQGRSSGNWCKNSTSHMHTLCAKLGGDFSCERLLLPEVVSTCWWDTECLLVSLLCLGHWPFGGWVPIWHVHDRRTGCSLSGVLGSNFPPLAGAVQ